MNIMNIFDLPNLGRHEHVDALVQRDNVRIERIVSAGHRTDWYDQQEYEYVVLLTGNADIMYNDGSIVTLKAGDTLELPPHTRHRVIRTSERPPCVWLCVFVKPTKESHS